MYNFALFSESQLIFINVWSRFFTHPTGLCWREADVRRGVQYAHSRARKRRHDASEICSLGSGQLISIESMMEEDFIRDRFLINELVTILSVH